jgi:Uup-like ABC transporter family protein
VEEAEGRVTTCEARVEALRAELEDPALYSTPTGSANAQKLGIELEAARTELDRALKEWETASAARDSAADERGR